MGVGVRQGWGFIGAPFRAIPLAAVRRSASRAAFQAQRSHRDRDHHRRQSQSRPPLPLTVYRFTPDSVRHLADTNTGDASGDLGFFLDRRALTSRCAIDPTNKRCFLAPSERILWV